MTQKTIAKLIMLSIIVFMLQACNNELDSYGNSESEQGEISIGDDQKYYTTYYLPSSNQDQTTAFQNAVNRLGTGDVLVLRSGNHYISRTIEICSNIKRTIRGEAGSAVRRLSYANITCFELKDDSRRVTFDNVYVDGGGGPTSNVGIIVRGMYHKFKNCTFRNAGSAGMLFHFSSYNLVENCKVYYNGRVGVSQWNSPYNEIKNCQIYNNGGEGITVDGNSHGSNIHNNTIKYNSIPGHGLGGIGIDDSNDVRIYSNAIFGNNYDGIKVQNNLCGGVLRLSIYNNRIFGHNVGGAFGLRINNQPVTFGNTSGNVVYNNARGTVSYDNGRNAPCTWGDEGKPRDYHWCRN